MDVQALVNNPIFLFANALATFLGTLVGLYVLRKNRKSLRYAETEIRVFDRADWDHLDPNVHLVSDLGATSRLTRAYVLIWNTGQKTLHFTESLVDMTLRPKDGKVIGAQVIRTDDPLAGGVALVQNHQISFKFDYLLPDYAILFLVEHTGPLGESNLIIHEKERGLVRKRFLDSDYWHLHHVLKYGPIVLLLGFVWYGLIRHEGLYPASIGVGAFTAFMFYFIGGMAKRLLRNRIKKGAVYHYMAYVREIDPEEIKNNSTPKPPFVVRA